MDWLFSDIEAVRSSTEVYMHLFLITMKISFEISHFLIDTIDQLRFAATFLKSFETLSYNKIVLYPFDQSGFKIFDRISI